MSTKISKIMSKTMLSLGAFGFIVGAIFFTIPALVQFGEAGRTGSGHVLLIYSMLFGLQLFIFGFIGLFELFRAQKSRFGHIAIIVVIVGIPFLMLNHGVSLLELLGEAQNDVIFAYTELLGIGFFALFFPLGLFLIGLALVRVNLMRTKLHVPKVMGWMLTMSSVVMFSGLLIAPWMHHVGIILVAGTLSWLGIILLRYNKEQEKK